MHSEGTKYSDVYIFCALHRYMKIYGYGLFPVLDFSFAPLSAILEIDILKLVRPYIGAMSDIKKNHNSYIEITMNNLVAKHDSTIPVSCILMFCSHRVFCISYLSIIN